jgi:NAD(P)H-dependent FMN reductase
MHSTIKVGLVYGSTRKGRFCDVVANWAAQQVASEAQLSPTIQERIGASDAFVVVTPEYNHGYPAPLKAMIDSVGAEWHAKPVAFVSYGGISGGLRAVEQLRQVFAEMHAVIVRDTVSFASAWEQFDPTGQLLNPARAERSMKMMLARLHWWATALRTAREATPFLNAA